MIMCALWFLNVKIKGTLKVSSCFLKSKKKERRKSRKMISPSAPLPPQLEKVSLA